MEATITATTATEILLKAKETIGLRPFMLTKDHIGPTGWLERGHTIPALSSGTMPSGKGAFAHLGFFETDARRADHSYDFRGTGHLIVFQTEYMDADRFAVVQDNGSCSGGYVMAAFVEAAIEARRTGQPVDLAQLNDDGEVEVTTRFTPIPANIGPRADYLAKLFDRTCVLAHDMYEASDKGDDFAVLSAKISTAALLLRFRQSPVMREQALMAQVLSMNTVEVFLKNLVDAAFEPDHVAEAKALQQEAAFHARLYREALYEAGHPVV